MKILHAISSIAPTTVGILLVCSASASGIGSSAGSSTVPEKVEYTTLNTTNFLCGRSEGGYGGTPVCEDRKLLPKGGGGFAFPVAWEYVDIPGTRFSLPLSQNYEIKVGNVIPTVDVYSMSDAERRKFPDSFFGLFIDEACTQSPNCAVYLWPFLAFDSVSKHTNTTILSESVDSANDIRLRHFVVSKGEQKRHYFMVSTIEGTPNTVIKVFPDDISETAVQAAWNAMKHMRISPWTHKTIINYGMSSSIFDTTQMMALPETAQEGQQIHSSLSRYLEQPVYVLTFLAACILAIGTIVHLLASRSKK